MNVVWVMAGGALGSGARYLIATRLNATQIMVGFPLGTLCVNLAGCLIIGLLSGALPEDHPYRLLLMVGLLGGFTTFSSFGLETTTLINEGRIIHAALYVFISNVGGCLLAWMGSRLV